MFSRTSRFQFGSLRSLMSETSPSFVLILASYSTIPTIERSTAGQWLKWPYKGQYDYESTSGKACSNCVFPLAHPLEKISIGQAPGWVKRSPKRRPCGTVGLPTAKRPIAVVFSFYIKKILFWFENRWRPNFISANSADAEVFLRMFASFDTLPRSSELSQSRQFGPYPRADRRTGDLCYWIMDSGWW